MSRLVDHIASLSLIIFLFCVKAEYSMFKSESTCVFVDFVRSFVFFVFCFYREHSLLISQQGESNKSKPVTVNIYKSFFLNFSLVVTLFLVVQMLDSTIYWINHYPAGKVLGNQLIQVNNEIHNNNIKWLSVKQGLSVLKSKFTHSRIGNVLMQHVLNFS